MQHAPADQVHMQVKYRLPRARPDIQHGAIPVFDRALLGDMGGGEMAAPHQFRVGGGCFFEAGNMFLRNHQHVGRPLRVDVFKGIRVFVLEDFLGRNLTANNSAEQAIFHMQDVPS